MAQQTTDRQSKNNVFVDMFSDMANVYRLYRELHPEDTDVTVEDITVETLGAVIVNTLYNDLSFLVKDKLITLVEAQSTWCPNIPLRMMFYLAETYRRYLDETVQSVHSHAKVRLPRPELHVIYTGTAHVPEEISFNDTYFDGQSPVDVRVKVFHSVDASLCGQYVGFCRVFDEQRAHFKDGIECAKETIRICKERGYLTEYLSKRETEVINMMSIIFDEDYQREQYDKSRFMEGKIEGKIEGKAETALNLLRLGLLSKENIAKATGLPLEKINELATSMG